MLRLRVDHEQKHYKSDSRRSLTFLARGSEGRVICSRCEMACIGSGQAGA